MDHELRFLPRGTSSGVVDGGGVDGAQWYSGVVARRDIIARAWK